MPNKPLSPPPRQLAIVKDSQSKTMPLEQPWGSWFDDLYYQVSTLRSIQTITVAQAVNPDSKYVKLITSAASYVITLEAPTVPGLFMMIEMFSYTSGKNVTMSLANCSDGTATTTCTWNGPNQKLILMSSAQKWCIIKQAGVTLT